MVKWKYVRVCVGLGGLRLRVAGRSSGRRFRGPTGAAGEGLVYPQKERNPIPEERMDERGIAKLQAANTGHRIAQMIPSPDCHATLWSQH